MSLFKKIKEKMELDKMDKHERDSIYKEAFDQAYKTEMKSAVIKRARSDARKKAQGNAGFFSGAGNMYQSLGKSYGEFKQSGQKMGFGYSMKGLSKRKKNSWY